MIYCLSMGIYFLNDITMWFAWDLFMPECMSLWFNLSLGLLTALCLLLVKFMVV